MNSDLKKLIEVNQFDLEVSRFNPLIEEKRAPIYAKEDERAKYEKERADLEVQISQNTDLLNKSNAEFLSISADMEKVREKLKDSKSEKETKNLSMEEDILREKVSSFNNEIDSLESKIKAAKERIAAIDESIIKIDKDIEELEKSTSGDIEKIKKEQGAVSAKRQNSAIGMEVAVLRLYEKIRKWAGNSSVISIYKGACGGCFIKLNEKIVADIKIGDEIVHCPHCGRILYDSESLSLKGGKSAKDSVASKDSVTTKDSVSSKDSVETAN